MAKLKARINSNKINFYRGELHICTAIIHETRRKIEMSIYDKNRQSEFMFYSSIMADELLALENAANMVKIYGFQNPNLLELKAVVEQYVDLI